MKPESLPNRNFEEEARIREIYAQEGMPEVKKRARESEPVAASFLKEAFPGLFANVEVGSDRDDRMGVDLILTLRNGRKIVVDWTIAKDREVLMSKAERRLNFPIANTLYDERGKPVYQGKMPHLLLSGLNGFPQEEWGKINQRFWKSGKQAMRSVPNPEEFRGFLFGQLVGGLRHLKEAYATRKDMYPLFVGYLDELENFAAESAKARTEKKES